MTTQATFKSTFPDADSVPTDLMEHDRRSIRYAVRRILLIIDSKTGAVGIQTRSHDSPITCRPEQIDGQTYINLPERVDASRLREYVESHANLIHRIHAGTVRDWEKGLMLNSDASEACVQLEEAMADAPAHDKHPTIAEDVFWDTNLVDLGITADTSREEIEDIASGLLAEIPSDIVVVDSVADYLEERQDEICDEVA